MNWIKRNLIWLVGLLFFLLIILGSLLVLKNKVVEMDRVMTELKQQEQTLEQLVKRANYPDNTNVNALKQDNDELEKRIGQLVGQLAKSQVPTETLTGIKFRETVNNRTQALQKLAKQEGVSIPGNSLFGFDRYEKTIPDTPDVPLLVKQLNVIDELVTTLFRSRVLLMDTITRVEFEDADAEEMAKGKRRGDEATVMPNGFKGIQNDPAKIYTMMPFEIAFATDSEGLRSFVNNLSKSKYVLIPAYIRVKAEEMEVTGRVLKPEIGPEGELIKKLPEEVQLAEQATKFVLGLQKINVQMKIDWYEFRPVEPEKKGREKPEAADKKDAPGAAVVPGAPAPAGAGR